MSYNQALIGHQRIVNTLIIEAWRPLCPPLMLPSALQTELASENSDWGRLGSSVHAATESKCAAEEPSPSVLQRNGAQLVPTANIRRHTAAYVPCT